jgi:aspartate ammonia-lyase
VRHRSEHDLLGTRDVPVDVYYGIHTLRALENFAVTGTPIAQYSRLIQALAAVKQAAAGANLELGHLEPAKAGAIVAACEEILRGDLHDQFVVDVMQGGAGTSTNMNANEVIANRALELLGRERGEYEHLHPLEDVNQGQSTNDVYPTALRLALHGYLWELVVAVAGLRDAFRAKGTEFDAVLKLGRTQLQDAVPMTLGQEFAGWGTTLDEEVQRIGEAMNLLREVNLGGTAIGTGMNAPAGYRELVCRRLAEITGVPVVSAPDLVEATQDAGVFITVSAVVKRTAVKISKICNDLRLLSSGPRAGFGEINLPPQQGGSSIMPGKVNPVIPELLNQIAFDVVGNDITVTMAAEAGQLQLNAFEPVIALCLFRSIVHLRAGCATLTERCVRGITANADVLARNVERSTGLVTALSPLLGYDVATEVAAEALRTGCSVREVVHARGLLSAEALATLLPASGPVVPPAPRRPQILA